MHFTYAGCTSVRRYKPQYCGSCSDGRCCTPSKTRTMRVRFRCDDGDTFQKSMMWVEKCRCHQNCPYHSELSYPHYRLHNDIHKFTDWVGTWYTLWTYGVVAIVYGSPTFKPFPTYRARSPRTWWWSRNGASTPKRGLETCDFPFTSVEAWDAWPSA